MKIAEITLNEAMDPLAKELKAQARAEQNKRMRQQQKTPSYYVQFHLYPGLQKTAAIWWVTPSQLHYTYDEAAASGQARRLDAEDTIRAVSKLIYDLGDYYAPALKQKKVELIVPPELKSKLPSLYLLLKEWQYRVEAGNNRLIQFRDKLPVEQPTSVTKSSARQPVASYSTSNNPTPEAIERRRVEIFRSDPGLSAAYAQQRSKPGIDREINQHILDYWDDKTAATEEISATLGVS